MPIQIILGLQNIKLFDKAFNAYSNNNSGLWSIKVPAKACRAYSDELGLRSIKLFDMVFNAYSDNLGLE